MPPQTASVIWFSVANTLYLMVVVSGTEATTWFPSKSTPIPSTTMLVPAVNPWGVSEVTIAFLYAIFPTDIAVEGVSGVSTAYVT